MKQITLDDYLRFNKSSTSFLAITEYAKKGSLMHGSKERILKAFNTLTTRGDKIKFLKNEYGIGGFGYRSDKPNVIHHANFDAKGHNISYNDDKGICRNIFISYPELEDEITRLIQEGEFL